MSRLIKLRSRLNYVIFHKKNYDYINRDINDYMRYRENESILFWNFDIKNEALNIHIIILNQGKINLTFNNNQNKYHHSDHHAISCQMKFSNKK